MNDKFFDSNICKSRAHCKICREPNSGGGKSFRLSVIKKYGNCDVDSINFECKNGIEWKCEKQKNVPTKSRGVGDTVDKFTRRTGIKQAVNFVSKLTGIPCNCPKRQKELNEKYPYAD